MGDAAHQATPSDHNLGNAFDLTHDPVHWCDSHRMVRFAVQRRDPRIKYAISNRRIWSQARAAEGWRVYSGTNPHEKHAHVSIFDVHRNSTAAWWTSTPPPEPAPPPLAVREGTPLEIDVQIVPVTVSIGKTDNEGRGNVWVPYTKASIVGYLPQGLRPNVDGRYVTPDVSFAEEGNGTVISVEEWFPLTEVSVDLRVAR